MSNILGNMPPVFGSGYRGVVPAPTAADVSAQNILRADGTWGAGPSGTLPSQTGNAGELLTTDGTNASWASSLNTFQFGDVTLGSSGPSVKSTLSARAPRQGLVFDGTAGATVANVPAFGTSNYSFAVWVLYKTSSSPQALFDSGVNGCVFAIAANGQVLLFDRTASATRAASTTLLTAGKSYFLAYSRTGQIYIDGIADGAVVADGSNYTSTTAFIGKSYANTEFCFGSISNPLIYNRALSASEVVALYEAGAPADGDFQTAGQKNSSSFATTVVPYTTFTGASATGFTAARASGTGYVMSGNDFTVRLGAGATKVRFSGTVTLNNGKTVNPFALLATNSGTTISNDITLGSGGAFSIVLTASVVASSIARVWVGSTGDADYTITNAKVEVLGLLLAPDAAQAGGGLVWYDTSGNAANITLPASGVSWNVPFAGYLTAPVSSDLTLAGGNSGSTLTLKKGTSLKAGLNIAAPTGYANTVFHINDTSGSTSSGIKLTNTTTGTTNDDGFDLTVSGSNALLIQRENAYMAFYTNATETMRLFANGNLFVGASPVDSANGKLQLATHTTSAGGIGFGSDNYLFRSFDGRLQLGTSYSNIFFELAFGGAKKAQIWSTGSVTSFGSTVAGASVQIQSGAEATALTLDSSQNATFAGTGTSSCAGNLNIKGALGAHQTATLNLAYEGSSVSQLVAYGADASTLGRVNVILRKAGTGTDAVTGLSVRDFGIITQGGVAQTPASASATGTAGTIQWDASYIYICTATNTWKRVAIATW